MKIKKGDKLTFVGFEKDAISKNLTKIVFETSIGNRIELTSRGEPNTQHCLEIGVKDKKKLEEEMEIYTG